MRRSQQTPIAAKQRGNLDDSPVRSVGYHSMAPISVGASSESRYRLKHFLIGIAVLCTLFFGCFDLLVFTTSGKRSGYSELGESQVQGERLPLCAFKQSSSQWKVALMELSNAQSTTNEMKSEKSSQIKDDSQTHSRKSYRNTIEKSNKTTYHDKSSIRQNPRIFHDMTRFSTPQQSDGSYLPSEYCTSLIPDAGLCVKESEKLGLRCLPSFLIIGTLNSGGNHLMKWLNKHPNLQSGDDLLYFTLLCFTLFYLLSFIKIFTYQ